MESPDERLKAPIVQIIPFIHSWICVIDDATGEPQFGPSKFAGYRDMTVSTYANHFKQMDGRDTERAIQPWVRLVTEADGTYEHLHQKLHEFCAQFDAKPRARCRISILAPEADCDAVVGDRDAALMELLIKVCEGLPAERQQEIARRIARR